MTTHSCPGADPGRSARMERLAATVYEPVQRYLRRRTDPETAADVLADSLLVLWQRLDDVPTGAELPWAYAVARRCLANAQRTRRRQLRLVQRLAAEPVPLVSPPGGDDAAADDERLDAALAALREQDREVLRLWAWERLEAREIAQVLGVSANAAAIRLHRARRRLARLLDRKDGAARGGTAEGEGGGRNGGRNGGKSGGKSVARRGQEPGDRAEEVR